MTTNTAHTRTYIEQKRAEYEAASSPAGDSRLHLLPTHGEALPGEELGRMAQHYEDVHEGEFRDEMTSLFFWGVLFLSTLAGAGALIAAPHILRFIAWMVS